MNVVPVLLIVIGGQAAVWLLIFAWFKWKARTVAESINASFVSNGECLVIGPERGYYNIMKGAVSVSTMGIIALTNRRVIFKGPMGMNADIAFDEISDTSLNTWFQGNYRNGRPFMILRLRDGKEAGFQVRDADRWAREIQSSVISDQ